jgi:hypothetical protein
MFHILHDLHIVQYISIDIPIFGVSIIVKSGFFTIFRWLTHFQSSPLARCRMRGFTKPLAPEVPPASVTQIFQRHWQRLRRKSWVGRMDVWNVNV